LGSDSRGADFEQETIIIIPVMSAKRRSPAGTLLKFRMARIMHGQGLQVNHNYGKPR